MYKKIAFFAITSGLVLMYSCKQQPDKKTDDGPPVAAGMVRVNLHDAGINATIDIPDTSQQETKKVYGIKASSDGSINVFVGKAFNILINVSGEGIAMKKSDLDGDFVNKVKTWVVNDSNNLLYSIQKDTNAFANAKEEFHFYAIVKKGTTSYYVQDLQQGADGNVNVFGKDAAQIMLNAAKTLTPYTPPAKDADKKDNPS